jgi:hypothetical protein
MQYAVPTLTLNDLAHHPNLLMTLKRLKGITSDGFIRYRDKSKDIVFSGEGKAFKNTNTFTKEDFVFIHEMNSQGLLEMSLYILWFARYFGWIFSGSLPGSNFKGKPTQNEADKDHNTNDLTLVSRLARELILKWDAAKEICKKYNANFMICMSVKYFVQDMLVDSYLQEILVE